MRAAVTALLGASLAIATLLGPMPAAANEPTDPAGSEYQPPFDPAEVTAEFAVSEVLVLPGSIAVLDQQRVAALTETGDVKVLVVPPGPLDSAENEGYRRAVYDVAEAAERGSDGTVVRVVGLEVESVGQTDLAGARHLLQTFDVTTGLEFITPYLLGGEPADAEDETVTDRTDSALVADLTRQLSAAPVVVAEGVSAADRSATIPDPQRVLQDWRTSTGTELRLVVLPALQPGEPAGVTAEDLSAAFPGEVVALFQGRWFELAGPDQQVLTVARDMTLSRYMTFQESRQIGPANTLKILGDQYAELTSGAVVDQPSPTTRNPIEWLLVLLPLLVLLLIVVFGVRNRAHRNRRRERAVRHDGVADLAGAAAALPALADGILALDGLARTGRAHDLLTVATMRYRAARQVVADGRDGTAAAQAVLEGRQALTDAARLLNIPDVPGTLPATDPIGATR